MQYSSRQELHLNQTSVHRVFCIHPEITWKWHWTFKREPGSWRFNWGWRRFMFTLEAFYDPKETNDNA